MNQTSDNQAPEVPVTRYSLPTFLEATQRIQKGTATAIDRFVFFYQPSKYDIENWRDDFTKAIVEAMSLQPNTLREMLLADEGTRNMLEEIKREQILDIIKDQHHE